MAEPMFFGDRFQVRGESHWLFAYGSLIFRPGFDAAEAVVATLPGYARRFWQGSPDHRGTPAAPGRVVTLVEAPGERCRGLAYRIEAALHREVLRELDRREQAGFLRQNVVLRRDDGADLDATAYVANVGNPHFLGPASLEQMVLQIRSSAGPSGPNRDYVLELARALRQIGADDEHVFEIEAALLRSAG